MHGAHLPILTIYYKFSNYAFILLVTVLEKLKQILINRDIIIAIVLFYFYNKTNTYLHKYNHLIIIIIIFILIFIYS